MLFHSKKEIDMCNGPMTGNIILFATQIMLSAVIQLLFNTADTIVVGRFAGNEALAAVGSTASLINLLVGLFTGISVGANVLIAQFIGAKERENAGAAAHTAVTASFIGGLFLTVVGVLFAKPMLTLMGSPEDVIELAALYVQIYFIGVPFNLLYNFSSAVLKASGNAKQPLIYLSVSGVVNVLLNLLFVIVFQMSVAGVAFATAISQAVAAIPTVRYLMHTDGPTRIELKKLRVDRRMLGKILQLGFPAGIQGSMISLSNIIIQTYVNQFGSSVLAGNSAANNIEQFVLTSVNAIYQTAINFASQNRGAKKYDRTIKTLGICLTFGVIFTGTCSVILVNGGEILLGIYTTDAVLISYGMLRFRCIGAFYVLDSLMNVSTGYLRGMGYSLLPSAVTVMGMCVFRIFFLHFNFGRYGTLESIYASYPVTWTFVIVVNAIVIGYVIRKLKKEKLLGKSH